MTTLFKPFYNDEYDRRVSAVSMDARFMIIGQEDGSVSLHYLHNGVKVFKRKLSKRESSITAVCCEEEDDIWDEIFYVADSANNIFVLNKEQLVGKLFP